jgi:uncharacterized membrane protein YbhN (UPF0104 family)
MRYERAFIGFVLITILYISTLIWMDAKSSLFDQFAKFYTALPILFLISCVSYLARFIRWRWLLYRSGFLVAWGYGLISYIAGFAFTATPGKVGELIRIRYFTRVGVPPEVSFGAFVYERSLDLIVVLVLASLAISRIDLLTIAIIFVLIFITLLAILACNSSLLTNLSILFEGRSCLRLEKIVLTVRDGFASCRSWFTPLDLAISLGLGVAAWGVTSFGFMWLIQDLGISIPSISAFSIYPLAMLAGAASMLPGGVGSTELTIVILLGYYGVASNIAVLTAIGIRFATIWFSVLAGFVCIALLEIKFRK